MSYKVGVLGPINVDFIIRGEAPLEIENLRNWIGPSNVYCLTAGAAGYLSQNLKKLGNDVHLVSCIADDAFGIMIKNSLEKQGIDTNYIQIEKGKEGAIAIFILLFGDKKRPLTYRLPSHHGWPPCLNAQTSDYLLNVDLLHSSGYLHFPDLWNQEIPRLYKKARENNVLTSLDPQFPLVEMPTPWINHLKPFIYELDILLIDENEALQITGKPDYEEAARYLSDLGIGIIAVKLGNKGAYIKREQEGVLIPALEPKIMLDSIGAGDSFDAAFLQGVLEGQDIKTAGKMGVFAATRSLEGTGGTETFPKRDEIIL